MRERAGNLGSNIATLSPPRRAGVDRMAGNVERIERRLDLVEAD